MIIRKGRRQVTFVYQPEKACRRVQLAGSFNDWQPEQGQMRKQKDGTFRKRLELPPGEHRYKFLVDGQWVEDQAAEDRAANPFGSQDCLVTIE